MERRHPDLWVGRGDVEQGPERGRSDHRVVVEHPDELDAVLEQVVDGHVIADGEPDVAGVEDQFDTGTGTPAARPTWMMQTWSSTTTTRACTSRVASDSRQAIVSAMLVES